MSWYRESDCPKEQSYASPKVAEQKLDAGGNYVSAAPEGGTHAKPQTGNSTGPG